MIRLRPFKLKDAEYMESWIDDRKTFEKWCGNMFTYPLNKEAIEKYYREVEEKDDAFIFIAVDDKYRPVGHFLMRSVDYEKGSAYIAFVIVDREQRGKGYGKKMITLGVKYAFDILKLKTISLSVYDSNLKAYGCYKKIGFKDESYEKDNYKFEDESWGLYRMYIEC